MRRASYDAGDLARYAVIRENIENISYFIVEEEKIIEENEYFAVFNLEELENNPSPLPKWKDARVKKCYLIFRESKESKSLNYHAIDMIDIKLKEMGFEYRKSVSLESIIRKTLGGF